MRIRVINHVINLFIIQSTVAGDRDGLLLPGSHVFRRDMDNPVGIDVKIHLDLGDTSRSRGNTVQMKPSQRPVVGSHFSFSLENMNLYTRLVIRCC
ncbi:hypothetical protein ES703_118312 [subsurface metagenome]